AEDLVQETAAIVLAKAPPMATPDDLYRWTRRVAIRLHIDGIRKDQRVRIAAIPDAPDGTDVEHTVAQRIRLSAIASAVGQLSPADRDALITELPTGSERRQQVKHNVRRLRARARVMQLAGPQGLAGAAPITWLR